jgi:hypothetical protein
MSNQQPLVWRHEEMCRALGVRPSTGDRRRREGDWPVSIRIGHRRFYEPEAVRPWLANRVQSTATDRTAAAV